MKRIYASVALLGLAGVGCGGVADPDQTADGRPEREVALTDSPNVSGLTVLGPTWTESTLARHGGNGGTLFANTPGNAVIDFVRVRSGSEVDAIQFQWYRPTRADNWWTPGDSEGTTQVYGGSGGGWNSWFYCGGGKGIIGIYGGSGARVDRIGVICGDVNNPDPTSPFNSRSPLWGGGGGGTFADDKCTLNRVVDSFNIRSGSRLDNIQAICVNAH